MKKQIIVIGLGRFGISIATTLQNMGHDVLAVDQDEKCVASVVNTLTRTVQANATSETFLKEIGVKDFDVAIVAVGSSVESSVLCTLLLKKMGVKYIIARADEQLHGSILEKIGADVVVYPEREMGLRTAHRVNMRDVTDYMPVGDGYGIAAVPAFQSIIGLRVFDLGFGQRGKWEIALLLIQRKNEVIVSPVGGEIIRENDVLIVSGADDKMEHLLSEAKQNKQETFAQQEK
jgi:trk system potassium uptake protein